ncbi:MAG: recombinase RecA [Bacteroidaceae bacterium]|nr:recombinase RecA [Bacteroidaceae bacterium]
MVSKKTTDVRPDALEGNQAKLNALNTVLAKIEKDYGKGSIMKMSLKSMEGIEVIPSGSIGLDLALGCGGYPKGRIVEIYGPESSGKTTLAIHAIAECQKQGGICAFIDAEHAFDPYYASNLGVKVDNLLMSQPDCGEDALQIVDELICSAAVDLIVVDSVAALTPKKEIEGAMGDSAVGLHARLMSQALRKMTANISRTKTTVIFINQLREKIGVMFGNPETTTGGNALKFYASVRIDVRKSKAIKEGKDDVIGNVTKIKIVKNKVAPPFKRCEVNIMFGEGISRINEILDLGVELDIIKKAGAMLSYEGIKIKGKDNFLATLKDNEELAEEISGKIVSLIRNTGAALPVSSDSDEEEETDE